MRAKGWRRIDAEEVERFVREDLLDPARDRPVIALTTPRGSHHPLIDPEGLAADLGARAEVVVLETGKATWALAAALSRPLGVFGGEARIWWPGLTLGSEPLDHPLIWLSKESPDRARRRILADVARWEAGAVAPGEGRFSEKADREQGGRRPRDPSRELRERVRKLEEELEAAQEERRRLAARMREAGAQAVSLRKKLRAAEDRYRHLEARVAGDLDPLSSEKAFLTAVRVEYARRWDEDDRLRYPLQRMRVGREFLQRARALEGVDAAKVIEVCAQVACGRAQDIPARAVHELLEGKGGAAAYVREADRAKAWRCSLQDGSPSARRLHWWLVPGSDGATVEFASVAVHDDFSIPE